MATPAPVRDDHDVIVEFQKLMEDYHTRHEKALAHAVATSREEVSAEIKALRADHDAAVEKFLADLRAVKQAAIRPPFALGAPEGGGGIQTLGHQFIEAEAYKAYQQAPTPRPRITSTIKSRLVPAYEQRAINPFISTETSGLVIYPKRVGVFTQPTIPLVMRDLLDVVPLDGTNAVEYVTETWTLNADYQIKEGDRKAQSDVTYADKTAVVRTIAHFVKISRQMLNDVPFIRASIDNRMVYGVALKEDKEILYGTGAAGHLLGIMPQATAYAAGGLPVTTPIDQVYAAIMQVSAAGYVPSAIVMNPLSFAGISMMKNSFGMYILGGPPATDAVPRLWGLPVALTLNMTAPDFLVGAFPGNAALFDREQVVVEISFENEDDFVRNLATIRAEERITLAVFVPQAFVKGALLAPSAAEAEAPAPPTHKSK
jgi:HK97 family phage major capsid protein